jgi:ribosomal protein S12 methylthiotransferase accessory factor
VGTCASEISHCTAKVIVDGTHRTRTPEDTWDWIKPKLASLGITRIADVTWLDEIGIPVFQAIRPNALTLSVSQGKGLTPALARVSAAMEAVELWHAENPLDEAPCLAGVADMEGDVGYPVEALALTRRNRLNGDALLSWRRMKRVDGKGDSFVPAELLRMDARFQPRWDPPLFQATSNGLASGNNLAEALLHGMYEVVERDALTRAVHGGTVRSVASETIDEANLCMLMDRFRNAHIQFDIQHIENPFRIPTFKVAIWSDAFPRVFKGNGTHLDAAVAMSRALTEAAQSRATAIAGARDDIGKLTYSEGLAFGMRRSSGTVLPAGRNGPVSFSSIASLRLSDIETELAHVTKRIQVVTGYPPLYADLSRADVAIPVTHVVCPGALFDATHEEPPAPDGTRNGWRTLTGTVEDTMPHIRAAGRQDRSAP